MIQPHLRVEKVSKYCILAGDPERINRLSKMLKESKKISDNRGLILYEGFYNDVKITAVCTGMGGPSMAIVAEELINAGAKYLLRVGSGAVLVKDAGTGDAIISTGVYKEGTSTNNYVPLNFPAVPDYDVLNSLIESAKESKAKFFYGVTISTDAFYSPIHRQTMIELSKQGVVGSEMEGAMLFTVAQLRGAKAGMIFHAGLNPLKKELPKDIISQTKAREEGEKKTIMIALNAIKKLSKGVKN